MPKVTFLSHATFLIESGAHKILIDPYLSGNPFAPVKPDQVKADFILVSHAHGDHLGDTVSIAKKNNALVISTAEVAHLVEKEGARAHAMHVGGKYNFDFGTLRLTLAFHGSGVAGGHACGFVISTGGKTIYHAGDTGLFGDMKLLGELNPLDLALIPIGGNYVMDIDDAIMATRLLNPKVVIPMHYNTFPVIKADPQEFKIKSERANPAVKVEVLAPGQSYVL